MTETSGAFDSAEAFRQLEGKREEIARRDQIITALSKDRDEAITEAARMRRERDLEINLRFRVEAEAEAAEAKLAEVQEAGATIVKAAERFRQEGSADRAEVERLRRLPDEIEADAKGLALGETFSGGPLDGVSVYNVMMWAVRRIRAALRGGGE